MKVQEGPCPDLFLRSGAIESSDSGVEQSDINRLAQISEPLGGHSEELTRWAVINPRRSTATTKQQAKTLEERNVLEKEGGVRESGGVRNP